MGDTLFLYGRTLFLRGIKKKDLGQITRVRNFRCHIFVQCSNAGQAGDFGKGGRGISQAV
jgi:hypothetical protein